MFLGYSTNSTAYLVYKQLTKLIGDVVFDDKVGFYQETVTHRNMDVTHQTPSAEDLSNKEDEVTKIEDQIQRNQIIFY